MNPAFLGSTVKQPVSGGGGGGGGGTYSKIVHAIANAASGTITTSGQDTTGANLTIVAISWYNGTESVTDSKGNTYTALTKRVDHSGNYTLRLYYCINPTVGAGHTASVSGAAFAVVNFYAFKLSSGTPVFDVQNGYNHPGGNVTTFQPGSVTPAGSNELFVLAATWDITSGTPTATVDSGFSSPDQSRQGSNNLYGATAWFAQTSGGALNPTITFAATVNAGAAAIAAFK